MNLYEPCYIKRKPLEIQSSLSQDVSTLLSLITGKDKVGEGSCRSATKRNIHRYKYGVVKVVISVC